MGSVSAKVAQRVSAGIKKFQPILAAAKARDVNESDTVVIVTDVLHEIFGYEKYADITSEHMIRSTFCDLAIKLDGRLSLLIEVKAIGTDLKDIHVKQAVDYAANQGCDWVALTNGICWRVYKVIFGKPIENELVVDLHLLELRPRVDADIELAALLAKEGWQKERLGEYQSQRQALSRFTIAAVLMTDPLLDVLRRELRLSCGRCSAERSRQRRRLPDRSQYSTRLYGLSVGRSARRLCDGGDSGSPRLSRCSRPATLAAGKQRVVESRSISAVSTRQIRRRVVRHRPGSLGQASGVQIL